MFVHSSAFLTLTAFVALLPAVLSSPLSHSEPSDAILLAKRERALSKLTPGVQSYLRSLDPSEYELDLEDDAESFDEADEHGVIHLKRQQDGTSGAWNNCKNGQVAVTYDDGPYDFRGELLSEWAADGHMLTFFQNGYNFGCGYDAKYVKLGRQALNAGHLIAGHSWSHYNFSQPGTTHEVIDRQIDLLDTQLLKTLGVVPRYFRFPYGAFAPETAQYLRSKYGLRVIQWSEDSGDSSGATAAHSIAVYKPFQKGESHIILNHETHKTSVEEVAPAVIRSFKRKGIKSVTAAQCIGATKSPYKVRMNPQKRDSTWTCSNKPLPGQAK